MDKWSLLGGESQPGCLSKILLEIEFILFSFNLEIYRSIVLLLTNGVLSGRYFLGLNRAIQNLGDPNSANILKLVTTLTDSLKSD